MMSSESLPSNYSIFRHLPRAQRILISFISFFGTLCFLIVQDRIGVGAAVLATVFIGIPAGLTFFVLYRIIARYWD